jgi:hypothetical protein
LPESSLGRELVLESLNFIKKHFLRDDGRWGAMDCKVWEAFYKWLQEEGLLTTHKQSRFPIPGVSVSLDELRKGNVGSPFPHDHIQLEQIFTNKCLELSYTHDDDTQ